MNSVLVEHIYEWIDAEITVDTCIEAGHVC